MECSKLKLTVADGFGLTLRNAPRGNSIGGTR
jgi:hypothetical protein